MARQEINVGSNPNDRSGDPLRTAFQKTNSNFTELYELVEAGRRAANTEWHDDVDNLTYSTYDWVGGTTITIGATPTEYANLVTYEARTDDQYIMLVWDQDFIDNVWDGYEHPDGEGTAYEASLDGGTTWYRVEPSGYSGGAVFYFTVPYGLEGQYAFTYDVGQPIQLRFNRGSLSECWFDLANAPIDANTVYAVCMDVTAISRMDDSSNTVSTATVVYSNVIFGNEMYNDNTYVGAIEVADSVYIGNKIARDRLEVLNRRSVEPEDAGRIYGKYGYGRTGTITLYWNAKLMRRT